MKRQVAAPYEGPRNNL